MIRVNYSFDRRYLLTVTARRDGSSVFGNETKKYATFPSVAVGWNISNENFMQGFEFISSLKIRASYGKSGNQAIQPYQTFSTQSLAPYVYSGSTSIGIIPSNLGNARLRWETTASTNLGLDFGLFDNRVNGSVEVYQATTDDLLLRRQLPRITGFVSIWDNVGKTENRGVEVTLNTVNIQASDFSWESGLNFSFNNNKVVELYGDSKDDIGNRLFIGKPLNAVYDFRLIGVWQQGEDASKHDPGAKPGDLKFADLNNDGKITSLDREYLGSSLPKFIAGLTNTIRYKNFSLTAFLQSFQGSKKPNAMLNRADFGGRTNQPAAIGYWTKENKSNERPALSYWNPRGYGYPVNSSYTRLKDITLTYRVGPRFLDRYKIGSLAIYASGRNIHTFTDWIGWDPEQFYDGTADSNNNRDNYPNVASYVLGINLSLR
jgi:TonB-linked SusC/RagA family outer membrane protein